MCLSRTVRCAEGHEHSRVVHQLDHHRAVGVDGFDALSDDLVCEGEVWKEKDRERDKEERREAVG